MSATQDDFLAGRLKIEQPDHGFRAGIDTVLLAASVDIASYNILELGSGTGVASCCLLSDLPKAGATLVDIDQKSLSFAKNNLQNNGFSDRAQTILLDITQKGSMRKSAGLREGFYTSVIANPPFFDTNSGTISTNISRANARHMPTDDLDKWVKCAATSAAPGGEIIFIHTIAALPQLLDSFCARFGAVTLLPICSRPQTSASRVLIRAIKGSRAPLSMLPPLVLHGKNGNEFSVPANAIFRGKSRLSWKPMA